MANFKSHISNFWIQGYVFGIACLFFYSFTQIDLGLTILRFEWVKQIETSFQYIGYFNRPLSTYLFLGIIIFLYFCYLKILFSIKHLPRKKLWILIFISSVLLAFSYNAFSYDLFNYIFDAKIITHYHQNPYEHKALDYAAEPMLSFMHWTHRVYPYGPVWLFITVPISFLGFQYFLLTFFLFKLMILLFFLGTVRFIEKILDAFDSSYTTFGMAFFALSPFVLIESVVSAHVDIVMMFFIMAGVYFLVKKKYLFTFFLLVLSYGVKFASAAYPLSIHIAVILMVGIAISIFSKIQKKLSWETVFTAAGCFMILPIILASMRTNFQPWYLLNAVPFAALAAKKYYVFIPTTIISFFALGEYMPFLFLGNWDTPVPSYLLLIRLSGIGIAILASIVWFFLAKREKNGKIVSL